VRDGADSIDYSSREIAAGNLDLSQRTEHQAGALEETASAMVELTEAVRANSGNARTANALAVSATEVADKGGAVVAQVVQTMAEHRRSSPAHRRDHQRDRWHRVPDQYSGLNAAVEAAAPAIRAGFAVVATEVRNWPSALPAAKEIKLLINESAQQIAGGSALARDAGVTMAEIVTRVGEVAGIIAAISSASSAQEQGIEQVNAAICEMDGVTQQNAALVEQAAAAAQAMQQQCREMAQLMGGFRLDHEPLRQTNVLAMPPQTRVAQRKLAALPRAA
jgi:methyl-accepting chemotaxis protein